MKITLRKANVVQSNINEQIKALDLNYHATLNEFQSIDSQISAVRIRFFENQKTRSKLTNSLYEIRRKVSVANATSGINDMLATVAQLEKTASFNAMLASKGSQTDNMILAGEINKAADVKGDSYSYNRRDLVTSIFTEAEVIGFKQVSSSAKKQRQRLQDQLLELNVRTEIELDAETTAFLQTVDII